MAWGLFLCIDAEKVIAKHQAPGSCPRCHGSVIATDVETQWSLCFLPLCLNSKRRYSCTRCFRELDVICQE